MFRHYLLNNIQELSQQLWDHRNPQDWMLLAKFVMSRLILFNKRREAEVRELRVDEYLSRPNWKEAHTGELEMAP